MYNDRNYYIVYQPCEYCGEQFHLYEKLVFPKLCSRNQNTPHFQNNILSDNLSYQ